jgi:hypothetical protein
MGNWRFDLFFFRGERSQVDTLVMENLGELLCILVGFKTTSISACRPVMLSTILHEW